MWADAQRDGRPAESQDQPRSPRHSPKLPNRISAASGQKFAVLWGRVEEILLFNNFLRLPMDALIAKI